MVNLTPRNRLTPSNSCPMRTSITTVFHAPNTNSTLLYPNDFMSRKTGLLGLFALLISDYVQNFLQAKAKPPLQFQYL